MTIGQQLRSAREERSVSLEQVAQETRIRLRFLHAIESDDFEALPSPVQVRGFIRAYASFLRLNAEPLLEMLETEKAPPLATPVARPAQTSEVVKAGLNQAEAIFIELGQKLRNQRELLGLSLSDVERHTHIRVHYLSALEEGNLDGLPSPVQGRGMLNNYAGFLGLDPEPLLLRFADGLQARLADRRGTRSRRGSSVPRRPGTPTLILGRVFSMDVLISAALIVFLVGFIAWGALRISAMGNEQDPTPTAPSIVDVLLSTPSATGQVDRPPNETGTAEVAESSTEPGVPPVAVTVEPGTPEPVTPTVTLSFFDSSPIQVYMVAHQRAWVRVAVDGEVEFEGRVLPGSAYQFSGDERVEVLTGNGAAIQVYYNQRDLGILGTFGEIAQRIFTVAGVQTPTPEVANTSTPAPTETPTPGGSPGPTITVTP